MHRHSLMNLRGVEVTTYLNIRTFNFKNNILKIHQQKNISRFLENKIFILTNKYLKKKQTKILMNIWFYVF